MTSTPPTPPVPPASLDPPGTRAPASTYRLQFGPALRFADALAAVPYLHRLGVTDLYASPIAAATPGSTHGYDVTDPTRLNPALGTEDDFSALADALASSAMGLLLDIVPNHMAAHHDNPWWWDVLENGPASEFAPFFDIRWDDDPDGRIVLPVLGAPLDQLLAGHALTLGIDADRGVVLRYGDMLFPIDPAHWAPLLLPRATDAAAALGESSPAAAAMTRLLSKSGPLPNRAETDPQRLSDRRDAIASIKRDLREALAADPAVHILLANALAAASRPEEPNVLSPIGAILDRQAYRLAYWKDGLERINYRRFFDISGLASLRADEPGVFDASHSLIRTLLARGSITGLRVDHIDGLADPLAYLRRLRTLAGDETFIIVEKILAADEAIPGEWPVQGTTGYDFLTALSNVFVDPDGVEAVRAHARRTLGLPPTFRDAAYESKRLVLDRLFPAETRSLAAHLARLCSAAAADTNAIRDAICATTAALDVYRTYLPTDGSAPRESDRGRIEAAIAEARRRDPGPGPAYDALRDALLSDQPPSAERAAFIRRWQQLTGPAAAKGVEDTALYRDRTLAGLNEVGGEPTPAPDPVAAFHRLNADRAAGEGARAGLSATSTHDTKRSEDARARLAVLSEIPERWIAAVDRWREANAACKRQVGGRPAPSDLAESLIYQSLVAVWPLRPAGAADLTARVQAAMVKSAREARLETSWSDVNEPYEAALTGFIAAITGGRPGCTFLPELLAIVRDVAPAAAVNSLSQLTLKLASPGAADFYQGTELWDFSLVDPDNRRPVNFASRSAVLAEIERRAESDAPGLVADLLRRWRDGRIKMYAAWRGLHARRERPDFFARAEYLPLHPRGPRAGHLVALARRLGGDWAAAVAPRLTLSLPRDGGAEFPLGQTPWAGTAVPLPPGAPARWRNVFTGEVVAAADGALPAAEVLRTFPTALLVAA